MSEELLRYDKNSRLFVWGVSLNNYCYSLLLFSFRKANWLHKVSEVVFHLTCFSLHLKNSLFQGLKKRFSSRKMMMQAALPSSPTLSTCSQATSSSPSSASSSQITGFLRPFLRISTPVLYNLLQCLRTKLNWSILIHINVRGMSRGECRNNGAEAYFRKRIWRSILHRLQ